MKFVKEEDENRDDYILQKDEKTKAVSSFTLIVLIILIIGVVASGFYFKWF